MNFLDTLPKPFFVLAPMDDVTDVVFRQIIASCAPPDVFFTEFVNVDGLQSAGRGRLLPKLQLETTTVPVVAQIWGKNPENYYKSAQDIVRMGFSGIDINMGCPDKAVLKNGCCAALIDNRGLAGEIIAAVREGVQSINPHFPVSIKTRVGLKTTDMTWIEWLLSQKLNMLTVHGRTAAQMSKVPANWELIGEASKMRSSLAPSTKIVGNGDVLSRSHGLELAQAYGLDGVMIGRGIFHDPYAFSLHSPWQSMTKQQRIDLYTSHVKLFAKTWSKGERKLHTLNKFCKVYIEGFPGAKEIREKLMHAESTQRLLELLATT